MNRAVFDGKALVRASWHSAFRSTFHASLSSQGGVPELTPEGGRGRGCIAPKAAMCDIPANPGGPHSKYRREPPPCDDSES